MNRFFQNRYAVFGTGAVWLAVLLYIAVPHYYGYGYKSYNVGSDNGYEWSRWGVSAGTSTVYLKKGQKLQVDYDITVRSGCCSIIIGNSFHPPTKPYPHGVLHRFEATTKGNFVYQAQEDGMYHVGLSEIRGKPNNKCDVSYTVSWHRR